MVNLNSILYEYGHICMYNGSRWLSDFAQKSYITFSDETNIQLIFLDINLRKLENVNVIKDL